MYSPKINEDLIGDLYRIAKAKHTPMTKLVNEIVGKAIKDIKIKITKVDQRVKREVEVYEIEEGG